MFLWILATSDLLNECLISPCFAELNPAQIPNQLYTEWFWWNSDDTEEAQVDTHPTWH